EPLTVDDLARRARMSRRTFVRAFRDSTGTTPASWVTSRRLDEARRLLEQTDLPIERVAEAAGYSSAITFRQNFSRAFAPTPTSYRRRFGTACRRTRAPGGDPPPAPGSGPRPRRGEIAPAQKARVPPSAGVRTRSE